MARKEIQKSDLKKVQKELKKYKSDYIPELVNRMNTAKVEGLFVYNREFNAPAIYNIFNGVTKDQLIRLALLNEAKTLLKEYNSKIKKALRNRKRTSLKKVI